MEQKTLALRRKILRREEIIAAGPHSLRKETSKKRARAGRIDLKLRRNSACIGKRLR